jgi:hypothetical protein
MSDPYKDDSYWAAECGKAHADNSFLKRRITDLEAEVKYEKQLNKMAGNRLLNETKAHNKATAQLEAVNNCQRYTHHNGGYTTDNPTGKWMKAEDVINATPCESQTPPKKT